MQNEKQLIQVKPGEIITRCGSRASSAFLVVWGTVGVYSDVEGIVPLTTEEGPAKFIRGTLIGDTEIFSDSPYLVTTKALSEAKLHEISAQRLRDEIDRCSPIVRGLVRTQAGRIRTLVQVLSKLQLKLVKSSQIVSPQAVVGEDWLRDFLNGDEEQGA